jgi:hypothetical protein
MEKHTRAFRKKKSRASLNKVSPAKLGHLRGSKRLSQHRFTAIAKHVEVYLARPDPSRSSAVLAGARFCK